MALIDDYVMIFNQSLVAEDFQLSYNIWVDYFVS